jgi:hypothetical protein
MPDVTVTVKGGDRVAAALRSIADGLANMGPANTRVGQVITAQARTYCPVRTGRLQGSIHPVADPQRARVIAGEGLAYANVQHYGWPAHHIRATLFLTRGLADSQPQWMGVYQAEVARLVKGAG